jgi:hypothetical protein
MKASIIRIAIALISAGATSAYAATTGAAGESGGPLIWSLIGFGVFVVMVQAIPAIIMLVSIIKALAAPAEKPSAHPKA